MFEKERYYKKVLYATSKKEIEHEFFSIKKGQVYPIIGERISKNRKFYIVEVINHEVSINVKYFEIINLMHILTKPLTIAINNYTINPIRAKEDMAYTNNQKFLHDCSQINLINKYLHFSY